MPKQPKPDPYHAFLCCPKCKERKLRKVLLDTDKRVGAGKNDRATLICDNCGFDLGRNRKKRTRKKKPITVAVQI